MTKTRKVMKPAPERPELMALIESAKQIPFTPEMQAGRPWTAVDTMVFIEGGGFDVRFCPMPRSLAKRIVLAVNNHDALVAALQKFHDHYPMGINPFLDDAYGMARNVLAAACRQSQEDRSDA